MDILKGQRQQNKHFTLHKKNIYLANDWWVREEPHISNERVGNKVTALVDGEEAMEAMAEAIKNAKKYIYITDWGMTATVRLLRKNNGPDGPQVKRVSCGVHHSLLKIALENHTSVSEIIRLNPNLDVITGWNTNNSKPAYELENVPTLADYLIRDTNAVISIPSDEEATLVNLLTKAANAGVKVRIILWDCVEATTPTDDVATEQILTAASPNILVSRHRPGLKTTHHQKSMIVDGEVAFVGGVDLYTGRWDNKHHDVYADPKIWGGDLYTTTISGSSATSSDPRYVKDPHNDRDHRLPWHDIHCRIVGPSVYDVEKNFVQRWNFQCNEQGRDRDMITLNEKIKPTFEEGKAGKDKHQKVQILRSVSPGAHVAFGDVSCTEHSIYSAYLNAMSNAQHFIYIENQFFVSNYGVDNAGSLIAQTIADRVIKAIEYGEPFKVIIVIPAHPEGSEYGMTTQGTMFFTMMTIGGKLDKYDNSMLNRIVSAIMKYKKIKNEDQAWNDLENYIGIYCLRNCGVVGGKLAHSQIYVHAKAMIVDDRIAIIGSANLNERSQLGYRDSEIAALIEDQTKIKIKIGPKGHEDEQFVRKFAHELRLRLWSEHLGYERDSDIDTIKNPYEGFDIIKDNAKSNTSHYENMFLDTPRNDVTTIEQQKINVLEQRQREEKWDANAKYQDIKSKLKGHIVQYPLYWLRDTLRGCAASHFPSSIIILGDADPVDSGQDKVEIA